LNCQDIQQTSPTYLFIQLDIIIGITFFLIGEILPKNEIENKTLKTEVIFGRFPSPKAREENHKNCQISIFGFQCVAMNIDG
jgi:membrane protein insertase Oxa1/YidC/SpoIIIJ